MIQIFVLYHKGKPLRWHEVPFYSKEIDVKMKFIKFCRDNISGQLVKREMAPGVFDLFTQKTERLCDQ